MKLIHTFSEMMGISYFAVKRAVFLLYGTVRVISCYMSMFVSV